MLGLPTKMHACMHTTILSTSQITLKREKGDQDVYGTASVCDTARALKQTGKQKIQNRIKKEANNKTVEQALHIGNKFQGLENGE